MTEAKTKTFGDLDHRVIDAWLADPTTMAALAMLEATKRACADKVIAFSSSADSGSTNAIRFASGVHEGVRLALSQLTKGKR